MDYGNAAILLISKTDELWRGTRLTGADFRTQTLMLRSTNPDIEQDGIPVVSLFSGAGGLDAGFMRAGFIPIIAVDGNDAACETYHKNHPTIPVIRRDLSDVSASFIVERISELPKAVTPVGVIGGPPCQAFSFGNCHKRYDDPRAELSRRYAFLIAKLNQAFTLDFFVFENVLGLRNGAHAAQLAEFKKLFSKAGFWIFEGQLNAYDFGVPQLRERLFIVGFNQTKFPRITFDFPHGVRGGIRTVRQAIGDLPRPVYFDDAVPDKSLPCHPNHWCMTPRSSRFHDGSLKDGHKKGRSFRVLNWNRPSWTVAYGHREVHVHPNRKRRLSVYEAMRLQGFPSTYRLWGTLSDQLRLVSDAVPPPLANGLAKAVRQAIMLRQESHPHDAVHDVFWNSLYSSVHAPPPAGLQGFFEEYSRVRFRRFPWRGKHVSPFHLIMAEVLLKQTKAEDVARIWPILIALFPTPARLSRASQSTLVDILRPLGLQRQRATALRKLTHALVAKFEGEVPTKMEALLSLPGLGLYAAAAACCFKFGQRVPIVDANVLRVFSRFTGIKLGTDLRRSEPAWTMAWSLLPRANYARHNYGILDFAAEVCSAVPHCNSCPLKRKCKYALQNGKRKKMIQ
jgi:DNA (cytosine-5)-methyltransferase 1